jgi:hypothetical protein
MLLNNGGDEPLPQWLSLSYPLESRESPQAVMEITARRARWITPDGCLPLAEA